MSRGKHRGARRRPSSPPEGVTEQRNWEYSLLIVVIVLMNVVGTVMVLSASSVQSIQQFGSPWVYFEHQLLWVAIGAMAFLGAVRVDYRRWKQWAVPLLVLSTCLLAAVLVPGIGAHADGSSRWVGAGSFRMQPSELAKLAVVLFAASLLARRWEAVGDWRATVRPLAVVVLVLTALILKQPDMGTAMIIVIVAIGVLFLAGVPGRQIAVLASIVAVAGVIFGFAEPYRRARLTSFLDPFSQKSDAGYQVVQSLSALGSGHIMGVGLGAGKSKYGFLPNAHTDFIFSVVGEELGLIGAVAVVALFGVLAIVGIRIARRSGDRFGQLLAGGITTWIVVQFLINVGAVIGMLPVTGVPLPFISYGGSALIVMMTGMGMMARVARDIELPAASGRRSRARRDSRPRPPRPADSGRRRPVPAPAAGAARPYSRSVSSHRSRASKIVRAPHAGRHERGEFAARHPSVRPRD